MICSWEETLSFR
jgi:Collagen triple helix repeat (20 copies)